MGLVSYRHFIEKWQAAEAPVALAEVSRLEELYRQEHGAYADNFALLRFSLPLQHYRIQVQLQNKGTGFQASALPLTAAQGASIQGLSHRLYFPILVAWLNTRELIPTTPLPITRKLH